MMSLSGAGLSVEDVHAYYQFFARREDGNIKTYVELGAVDGKSYSVSLFFQRLGWHGVLIEPYLPNYVLLAKAAARKYRVNVTILHAAACPRPRMLYFPLRASTDSNYDPFGHDRGVAMATSTESAARVLAKDAERGHKVKNPWSFTTMCLPMATLLQAAPQMKTARGIDFYSIDVEGHEIDVILSHDWDRLPARVVNIEVMKLAHRGHPARTIQLRRHLAEKGLCFFGINGVSNEVWVDPRYQAKIRRGRAAPW